ncbi:unnamed protein product, partial [Trichogramma brassicae]
MDANRAKLPQIIIGDFSGDIQDWVRFRDTFKEMVIDRPNLPNIFKMNYLRTYVKGEAAELLREIPSGVEHFANAWKVLLNHYDNTRLLINKLLESLMSMPAMVDNSASELMRVLNGTRNILQALKALGSPVQHWDHFTVFLTRSKITLQCQAKWEDSVKQKEHSTAPSSFDDLCKFLEAERSTLSLLESAKDFAKKTPQAKSSAGKVRLYVQTERGNSFCPVCSESHTLEQCSKFREQSANERKGTLIRKHLCFKCFGSHIAKDCEVDAACFMCNGSHHTLIHTTFKKQGERKSPEENEVSSDEQGEQSDSDEGSNPTKSVLTATDSNVHEEGQEALLSTARIRVSSDEGSVATVRALVNQCAQSSIVTEDLCRRLHLKKRRVKVPISGIGKGAAKSCAEVRITIRPHFESSYTLTLKAYVLPEITDYQPDSGDSEAWSRLRGLRLADPNFDRPGRVDVLLGTLVHARVMKGGLKKGNIQSQIAMNSHLGWILSGNAKQRRQPSIVPRTLGNKYPQLHGGTLREQKKPSRTLLQSVKKKHCTENDRKAAVFRDRDKEKQPHRSCQRST